MVRLWTAFRHPIRGPASQRLQLSHGRREGPRHSATPRPKNPQRSKGDFLLGCSCSASASTVRLVESRRMKQTGAALLRREEQLELYWRLESGLPRRGIDPKSALSGIGWLFELLPKTSRDRPVDPSGVMELHRCLAVLESSPRS